MMKDRMKIDRFVYLFVAVPLSTLLFWIWMVLKKLGEATGTGIVKVRTWWVNRKQAKAVVRAS